MNNPLQTLKNKIKMTTELSKEQLIKQDLPGNIRKVINTLEDIDKDLKLLFDTQNEFIKQNATIGQYLEVLGKDKEIEFKAIRDKNGVKFEVEK